MENNLNPKSENNLSEDIDLKEIFQVLWQRKLEITFITSLFFSLALIYSFFLPNIYESKALLSPVNEQNNVYKTVSNYSSIANLAGLNISPPSTDSNSVKALEKLESLSFFTNNILPNIFLPDLMALRSWDSKTNTITYDDKIYDNGLKKWVRKFEHPKTLVPSPQESFKVFQDKHLNINQDDETGFVSISVKHESPYLAKAWTEIIVLELNRYFRVKDKAEAQATVNYLNMQIAQTNFTEVKQVIAQLLQQKTQQLALIEVSEFYVFDYIDPPVVMEEKHEPQRIIIYLLGVLFGGIFAISLILARYYLIENKIE